MSLTPEQEAQVRMAQRTMPFRMIFVEFKKETNEFNVFGAVDKRAANKSVKEGNKVYLIQ